MLADHALSCLVSSQLNRWFGLHKEVRGINVVLSWHSHAVRSAHWDTVGGGRAGARYAALAHSTCAVVDRSPCHCV